MVDLLIHQSDGAAASIGQIQYILLNEFLNVGINGSNIYKCVKQFLTNYDDNEARLLSNWDNCSLVQDSGFYRHCRNVLSYHNCNRLVIQNFASMRHFGFTARQLCNPEGKFTLFEKPKSISAGWFDVRGGVPKAIGGYSRD